MPVVIDTVSSAMGFNYAYSTIDESPLVGEDSNSSKGMVVYSHRQSCHYCSSGCIFLGRSVISSVESSAR